MLKFSCHLRCSETTATTSVLWNLMHAFLSHRFIISEENLTTISNECIFELAAATLQWYEFLPVCMLIMSQHI